MKNLIIQLLFLIILAGFQTACNSGKDIRQDVRLVPWPRKITMEDRSVFTGRRLILINPSGREDIATMLKTCASDFSRSGFKVTVTRDNRYAPGATKIFFIPEADSLAEPGNEKYGLTVDSQITVTAGNITGLFLGSRTLLQLLNEGPWHKVPAMKIADEPVYGYRGVMVDAARHFHKMDFHLELIRKMAYHKLNYYMIHFSDNESYTLPSDIFPALPTRGRHYTKQEIRTLVKTAEEYNIKIVPSVDVPGHSGALIKGIPELALDRDSIKIDIARERTYEMLGSLFGELMELFPGPVWHLGADEVSYPGRKDAPCRDYSEFMEKLNITDGRQLQNYFINRMHRLFSKRGYSLLVWEGFDPVSEPAVSRDIIVCPFNIKYEGVMPEDYMNAGYKILNTSWSPLYIADQTSMTTPETFAMWTPLMFGAGRSPWPFKYWKKLKSENIPTEIIGAMVCSWANEEKAEMGLMFGEEAGPGYPDYGRPGPRVPIFSERVWSADETTPQDLLERTGSAYWDRDSL